MTILLPARLGYDGRRPSDMTPVVSAREVSPAGSPGAPAGCPERLAADPGSPVDLGVVSRFFRLWRLGPVLDFARQSSETPERLALAFAFGAFLSFSPFLGVQILVAFSVATLAGWHRGVVFAGLMSNLPWLCVPWYVLATAGGAWLLQLDLPADFAARLDTVFSRSILQAEFWQALGGLLAPMFWPFLVGSTVGAAAVAAALYALGVKAIRRVRHRASRAVAAETDAVTTASS